MFLRKCRSSISSTSRIRRLTVRCSEFSFVGIVSVTVTVTLALLVPSLVWRILSSNPKIYLQLCMFPLFQIPFWIRKLKCSLVNGVCFNNDYFCSFCVICMVSIIGIKFVSIARVVIYIWTATKLKLFKPTPWRWTQRMKLSAKLSLNNTMRCSMMLIKDPTWSIFTM